MSERNLIAFWACVILSGVWMSSGGWFGIAIGSTWLSFAVFIYVANKEKRHD